VQVSTTAIPTSDPPMNTDNLLIRSANHPNSGPATIALSPVAMYSAGSCFIGTPRLFTAKALAKGAIMKPPVASRMVAENPAT